MSSLSDNNLSFFSLIYIQCSSALYTIVFEVGLAPSIRGGINNSFRPAQVTTYSPSWVINGTVLLYIIVVEFKMSSPNPHALKNNLKEVESVMCYPQRNNIRNSKEK